MTCGALQSRLSQAIAECDVIISSGGVSMGDADPIKAVLDRMGRLNWLQLAIRPAKPFAYGILDGPTVLLGLPGNPVSSLVSFTLMAAPVLRRMMGHEDVLPAFIRGISDVDFGPSAADGRTAYLRAHADFEADGRLHARPLSKQDSHQLSAAAAAPMHWSGCRMAAARCRATRSTSCCCTERGRTRCGADHFRSVCVS